MGGLVEGDYLRMGPPADEILDAAEELEAGLIVHEDLAGGRETCSGLPRGMRSPGSSTLAALRGNHLHLAGCRTGQALR
jgi:hypothetical protein